MFFAGYGFYKRVFIGQGPGWTYQGDDFPTVEDIRDHLDQILETEWRDHPPERDGSRAGGARELNSLSTEAVRPRR